MENYFDVSKAMFKRLVILALLAAGGSSLAYMSLWRSASYSGRVVDEAGRPILGAIVGVGWVIKQQNSYPMRFQEAETGAHGQFKIDGWMQLSPSPFGHLTNSPTIYIVKRGYFPVRIATTGSRGSWNATPMLPSDFVLRHLDLGNKAENKESLRNFVTDLCADLGLFGNTQTIMNKAIKIKSEIKELADNYSTTYSNNSSLGDLSCAL